MLASFTALKLTNQFNYPSFYLQQHAHSASNYSPRQGVFFGGQFSNPKITAKAVSYIPIMEENTQVWYEPTLASQLYNYRYPLHFLVFSLAIQAPYGSFLMPFLCTSNNSYLMNCFPSPTVQLQLLYLTTHSQLISPSQG